MRLATVLDPAAFAERCGDALAGDPRRWDEAAWTLRGWGVLQSSQTRAFFVPGRLEIVGKHTDYAGGRSLVAATERGFHVLVAPREDRDLHMLDPGRAEGIYLDLSEAFDPGLSPARLRHWARYPATVVARMQRDFGLALRGATVVVSSDLPAAAGLSSSSALIVATWLALAAVNPVERSEAYRRQIDGRERLAAYLAAVEGGRPFGGLGGGAGVGTRGGSEDHTAILCSRSGCLRQWSYDPTRHERTVELPGGLAFAIGVSGVRAEKTGGARDAYNRAADLARVLAYVWRRRTGGSEPHLAAIRARGAEERERLSTLAAGLDDLLPGGHRTRRLEHFVTESEEIVPAATAALAAGELETFGELIDRSQRLAEELLGNQLPETAHLARSARDLGAIAASAFGAGFGGAVWALLPSRELQSFLGRWRDAYLGAFPGHRGGAGFFASRPGPGAFELGRPPG